MKFVSSHYLSILVVVEGMVMKFISLVLGVFLVGCIEIVAEKAEDIEALPDDPEGGELAFDRRSTVSPEVEPIPEQFFDHKSGEGLLYSPTISNFDNLNGLIHWVKDYGPDDVTVHPETGVVQWLPNAAMPSESFHIGLKVSAKSTTTYLSMIVHAGVTKVLYVGPGQEYTNIKAGLKAMESGETLVVLDGDYEGQSNYVGLSDAGAVQHPPNGTATAFTTIMAKHPSKAVFKNGAYVRLNGKWPVSYVAFKGFFVEDGQMAAVGYGENKEESDERHHHLKFIRNGVQGDTRPPFNAFRSDDILFENNYAYGGGRYKFASYQAENIVWRRNVARYDRGPVHDEPKGTYSVYTTMNGYISNNLAIDGDNPDFVVTGELAGEFTTPTTSGPTRAQFHRNIQLNSAFLFGNLDDQAGDSDVELKDIISWDVKPASRYVMTWGSAWFDHMTMGEIEPRGFADQFFNGYHNNTRGITNSILHNFSNGDMFYSLRKEVEHETVGRLVERYGVDTVNISNFTGDLEVYNTDIANVSELDPVQSAGNPEGSLRYLLRAEAETNMTAKGLDGGDLGANVMTLLGRSGTMHGEPGFDEETNIPMWPFPMEEIIKQKFSEYEYTGSTYSGHYTNREVTGEGTLLGARGFAVEGQSLTNYIWGYLGAVVPPFNVTATKVANTLVLQWDASPNFNKNVIGFKVYRMTDSGKQLVLDDTEKLGVYIEEGVNSEGLEYIVTAYSADEESSYGYVKSL